MLKGMRIQVNGGGVAGLSVATALAQRGARVRLLETASEITEVGAGLQISPNGSAVLGALGLGGALVGAGLINRAVELRDYRRGATVLRMDLDGADVIYPFVLIHRAALIDLLERGARGAGVDIRLGTTGGTDHDCDLLIGADGTRSALRGALNDQGAPFFTGQVAWRAVIDDDGAGAEAHIHMGPGRHLVDYALPGGRRNIVAVEERAAWQAEGWSQPDDPDNLRRAFAGFAPEVRGWLDRVESCAIWGLHRHPVAPRWHDETRVLIGDAAHPTLPFLAQGANMVLEDAWVLTECLGAHPLPQALARYQARRVPRVTRIVEFANSNARNYHLRNPLIRKLAHTALNIGSRMAPGATLKQFDWLYAHDVTAERPGRT